MSLKVTLVRSLSGHVEKHRQTVLGLGLKKRGSTRILQDTPAIRGMVEKVKYLLQVEETDQPFAVFGRRSRAKAQKAEWAKTSPKGQKIV